MTEVPPPPQAAPPWAVPLLDDVVTTADKSVKEVKDRAGKLKYRADYINWCRVSHLMRKHAPGWAFHLRHTPEDRHVWAAPNGTGYLVGYFRGPDGQETPDFPQAVMDGGNNAVPMESMDARDVTDTHRRCFAAAAAFTFGLAWQLWAKEPLEDPMQAPDRERQPRGAAPAPVRRDQYDEMEIDELAAAANRKLKQLGLTIVGFPAAIAALTEGKSKSISHVDPSKLRRLLRSGASAETIARWNAEGEALRAHPEAPEDEPIPDDDMPATWGLPVGAGAAP